MNIYRQQALEAVRAAGIRSATVHTWFGKASPSPGVKIRRALSPSAARAFLAFGLQSRLYNDFYTQGSAEPGDEQGTFDSPAGGALTDRLSRANQGVGCRQPGWEVRESANGICAVTRGGLQLWVGADECRGLPEDGEDPMPGSRIELTVPKEQLGISPGFYMAIGDEPFANENADVVRFYWNLEASGAVPFVRIATSLLNGRRIAFQLKVLTSPSSFARCDAGVLYIRRDDFDACAGLVLFIHERVQGHLKPPVPAFTKPLRPGLAFAENPASGESFGQHRCRILAEAIIQAHDRRIRPAGEKLALVAELFEKEGLDLDVPYLNPDSADNYHIPAANRPPAGLRGQGESQAEMLVDRRLCLDTAFGLARRLVAESHWSEGLCCWMGTDVDDSGPQATGRVYRSLGPDLYGGTAGVALFLAELYRHSPDSAVRECGRGAIRHALSQSDRIPPAVRFGLFTGWLGIALAAARAGVLLGEEELVQSGWKVLQRWRTVDCAEFDIISGLTGAICGLLIMRQVAPQDGLLETAARLGDTLLQRAENSEAGYSWRSPGARHRNLTGFSHGTAGAIHALLELYAATEEARFLEGALRALAYERYWFDAAAANWPDFRNERARGRHLRFPGSFTSTWCHGAPGIALSRLRAFEILNEEELKTEAIIAMETSSRMIERWLRSGLGNYSLCHGLCGNADVLLCGGAILRQPAPRQALQVAEMGRRHMASAAEWPCGTGGGESPNLMLGLAGIGHYYLRLFDPRVPSILFLRSTDFASERATSQSAVVG